MDVTSLVSRKMQSIELLMVCVVAFEPWMHFLGASAELTVNRYAWVVLLGTPVLLVCYAATLVLGVSGRCATARRWVLVGSFLVSLSVVHQNLPFTANHHYLFCVIFALFCLFDSRSESEAAASLSAFRRLIVIVFIWAGIKKLLHGNYFDGGFFAYQIAHVETFRSLFSLVLSQNELTVLQRLAEEQLPGPYRLSSLVGRAISNAAYAVEIVFGFGLLFARTRLVSTVVLIGFLVITQLAAREVVFGVVMLAGLLTFLARDWNRKLLPAYALLACLLAATRIGILPDVTFF